MKKSRPIILTILPECSGTVTATPITTGLTAGGIHVVINNAPEGTVGFQCVTVKINDKDANQQCGAFTPLFDFVLTPYQYIFAGTTYTIDVYYFKANENGIGTTTFCKKTFTVTTSGTNWCDLSIVSFFMQDQFTGMSRFSWWNGTGTPNELYINNVLMATTIAPAADIMLAPGTYQWHIKTTCEEKVRITADQTITVAAIVPSVPQMPTKGHGHKK